MTTTRQQMFQTFLPTEIGFVLIRGSRGEVMAIDFDDSQPEEGNDIPPLLLECRRQLQEYFEGRLHGFQLALGMHGTPFQVRVWRALLSIPYGQIRSYGWLARQLGNAQSARAVGGANHRNPLSIVVPCHRVVGSDGRLIGYGGGLWRKEWLLAHEKKHLSSSPRSS